jgi:hypothetical protein
MRLDSLYGRGKHDKLTLDGVGVSRISCPRCHNDEIGNGNHRPDPGNVRRKLAGAWACYGIMGAHPKVDPRFDQPRENRMAMGATTFSSRMTCTSLRSVRSRSPMMRNGVYACERRARFSNSTGVLARSPPSMRPFGQPEKSPRLGAGHAIAAGVEISSPALAIMYQAVRPVIRTGTRSGKATLGVDRENATKVQQGPTDVPTWK